MLEVETFTPRRQTVARFDIKCALYPNLDNLDREEEEEEEEATETR